MPVSTGMRKRWDRLARLAQPTFWPGPVGARAGYTFEDVTWSPRIGLQFDVASGDRDASDGTLGTFNPLFPNGFYFSLGGHTGYANLIHLKPSITVQPTEDLTLMAGGGLLPRQTTDDAAYTLPEAFPSLALRVTGQRGPEFMHRSGRTTASTPILRGR